MDNSSTSTVDAFQHHPLPDASNHLRLLEVLDDDHSDTVQVRCRITAWPINRHLPSYHAISYTWGDANSLANILVNDHVFEIRANCEFVLKQAYWYNKGLYYWVDAICINQEDLTEKSKQVAIMGDIFQSAAHVLACVGDHTDDSLFLFRNLEPFLDSGEKPPLSWPDDFRFRFPLFDRFSTTVRIIRAAVLFLERTYFTRLWVFQELRLAQEATFVCGADVMPRSHIWRFLVDILESERFFEPEEPASAASRIFWHVPFIGRRQPVSKHYFPPTSEGRYKFWEKLLTVRFLISTAEFPDIFSSLILICHVADSLQCENAKDKIYGILSLIEWGNVIPIITDYAKSDLAVAADFIRGLSSRLKEDQIADVYLLQIYTLTISNMDLLDHRHIEIRDAFLARRGIPEDIFELPDNRLRAPVSNIRTTASGWRISSEHLAKHKQGFLTWTPPGLEQLGVYLPYWTRTDDWILHLGRVFETNVLVVMRESDDSSVGPILGLCVRKSEEISPLLSPTQFQIHWDAEDLICCLISSHSLFYLSPDLEEWREWLNMSVCRQRTPGTSYAVRHSVL